MSIEPYDAYTDKDRISEWTGPFPKHWDSRKLKFVAHCFASNIDKKSKPGEQPIRLCNYTDVYYNDEITAELEFMKATATPEQIEKFLLREGDTIITKDSEDPNDIAVPTFVPETLPGVICAYHLSMIRPKATMNARFLNWAFQANYARSFFATRANGLTRYGLGAQALGEWDVPIPSEDEQKQIASFLDYETAKIDALIEKQQQLIALLGEKRQAVISHAVTKGLNPDAPMRDSGVEWLGEVPEHWVTSSLRHFATFYTGSTPDRSAAAYWNGDIPWVKTGEVKYERIFDTEEKISKLGLDSSSCSVALVGTLLMALYGQGVTRGRVALLGVPAAFNQACVAINPDKRLRSDFLHAFFLFAYPYIRVGNETTQMNMNVDFVRRIPVVTPPLNEQVAIVKEVDETISRFDELNNSASSLIELLQERRTALISAAVTGKIDVRGWKRPSSDARLETEMEVA